MKDEESDEEPVSYFATSGQPPKKAEDSVTGTIEAKLDFKKFREFREVNSIRETYKFKKILGEGAFGTVYEAMHI